LLELTPTTHKSLATLAMSFLIAQNKLSSCLGNLRCIKLHLLSDALIAYCNAIEDFK
jgi:hypothetical protein